MRISGRYMSLNECGGGREKLQGDGRVKVEDLKYLRSTDRSDGECGKEVKKPIRAGWNWWQESVRAVT